MAKRRVSRWAKKRCVPCEGGVRPLGRKAASQLLKELPGWSLSGDARTIFSVYLMKNFASAVELIRRIGRVADAENHHPDLHLVRYRILSVDLDTHAIGGLSENDFILADRIHRLPKRLKKPA